MIPAYSSVEVLVVDDTTLEARPDEARVLIDEWARHHRVALTLTNASAVDRLMVALAEVRDRLTTSGAA